MSRPVVARELACDRLIVQEYAMLQRMLIFPHLRAWVREAANAVEANNRIAGAPPCGPEEKEPTWLERIWESISAPFTRRSQPSS